MLCPVLGGFPLFFLSFYPSRFPRSGEMIQQLEFMFESGLSGVGGTLDLGWILSVLLSGSPAVHARICMWPGRILSFFFFFRISHRRIICGQISAAGNTYMDHAQHGILDLGLIWTTFRFLFSWMPAPKHAV